MDDNYRKIGCPSGVFYEGRERAYRRPVRPRMTRRCRNHDYRSVSTYMITLNKSGAFRPDFCRIFDAGMENPDYAAAKRSSLALTPGIARIRLYPCQETRLPVSDPRPHGAADEIRQGRAGEEKRAMSIMEGRVAVGNDSASKPFIPAIWLSDCGAIVRMAFRDFFRDNPCLDLRKIVVMPDHIHFIVKAMKYLPEHVGLYLRRLKGLCTGYVVSAGFETSSVFEEDYHDRIILNRDMLDRERRYLEDNPRRHLLRRLHPEYFDRLVRVSIDGVHYIAFGNIFLLKRMLRVPVKVSRRFTVETLDDDIDMRRLKGIWLDGAREGMALVSPFISPGEKGMRELILQGGGSIVEIRENGFPERYKPTGRNFDLCCEGRLLQIAPPEYQTRRVELRREHAQAMNELARKLASIDLEKAVMKIAGC